MSPARLLLRLGIAAFIGIMLAGPGAAVFPRTLRWGAWAACGGGSVAAPERYRASYSRPGESQVRLLCVAPDGSARDRTLAAIGTLFVMYTAGLTVLFSLLALRSAGQTWSPPPTPPVPPSAEVEAKARALLARGQTIAAIRVVRGATGMGLKEAKDWVEALPSRPAASGPPAAVASPESGAAPRLAELQRLADAGLITPDEHAAKRAEILAQL